MREMSGEMMKLGIIDELIEDSMESMEPEGLEEQAQVCRLFSFIVVFPWYFVRV